MAKNARKKKNNPDKRQLDAQIASIEALTARTHAEARLFNAQAQEIELGNDRIQAQRGQTNG